MMAPPILMEDDLGQIVIDATNPFVFSEFRPADLDGRSSSEIVAELVQDAWVVTSRRAISQKVRSTNSSWRPHRHGLGKVG